jgi:hypothetical protein
MSLLKLTKKRKVDLECRVFNEQWTQKYFFVQIKDKAVCLVRTGDQSSKSVTLSGTTMRVIKKKYDVFQGQVRTDKSKSLQRALLDQQDVFKSRVKENLSAVRAGFHVAELIAQEGKPFTDGEFVKRCFMSTTEELFSEKKRDVPVISVFLPVQSLGELMTLVTSNCHV